MSVRILIASIQNAVANKRYLLEQAAVARSPMPPRQYRRMRRAYQFWSRLADILGCPPF